MRRPAVDNQGPDAPAVPTASAGRTRPGRGSAAELDDSALVAAAGRGSEQAYAELYTRHVDLVRLVVAERSGDRLANPDVVQEAFARGFARLHHLRDPRGFRPWLLQIARRAAVDHRRRHRPAVSLDAEGVKVPPAGDDVPTAYEGRVADRELVVAIDQLPARQALALRFVLARGATDYDHLAELLGTSPSSARTVIYRARRRLRELLAARWDIDLSEPTTPSATPSRTEQA